MTLEDRVTQLEGELASLRRRNGALVAFALIALTVPAILAFREGQEKVIRAERFEVVQDGKTVAELSASEYGGWLKIYNKEGKFAAFLGALPDGGGLGIFNKDGKAAAALGALPDGGGLGIFNNDEKPVAELGAASDGGWLELTSPDGRVRFKAP